MKLTRHKRRRTVLEAKTGVVVALGWALLATSAWLIAGTLPGSSKAEDELVQASTPTNLEPVTVDGGQASVEPIGEGIGAPGEIEFKYERVYEITGDGLARAKVTAILDGEKAWSLYVKDLNPLDPSYITLPSHDMRSICLINFDGNLIRKYPVYSEQDPWFIQGNESYMVYGVGGYRLSMADTTSEETAAQWVVAHDSNIRWRVVDLQKDAIVTETSIVKSGCPIRMNAGEGKLSWVDVLYISNLDEYVFDNTVELDVELRRLSLPDLKIIRRHSVVESKEQKEELLAAYHSVGFGSLPGFTGQAGVLHSVEWGTRSSTLIGYPSFFTDGNYRFRAEPK